MRIGERSHALQRTVAGLCLSVVAVTATACGTSKDPAADPSEPIPSEDITPVAEMPDPDPTTPAPEDAVTPDDLPPADEITWNGEPVFTAAAEPPAVHEQFSRCQPNTLAYLGPNATVTQRYTADDPAGPVATVVAMSFNDEAAATEAREEIGRWIDDCATILSTSRQADAPKRLIDNEPVEIDGGTGVLNQWSWEAAQPDPAEGFESEGVIQIGNRVALATMATSAEPGDWSLDPGDTGRPLHPMVAAMRTVADRMHP